MLDRFRAAVEDELLRWATAASVDVAEFGCSLQPLADQVTGLTLAGGKRLRAAMVLAGHQLVGAPQPRAAVRCAAAMEVLHSFALLHDDVIDRSETRRGHPTAQIALRDQMLSGQLDRPEQAAGDGRPDAAWYGVSGAILAGDLALAWSDAMFDGAGLDAAAHARVRAVVTRLRVEAITGEFLDAGCALAGTDGDQAAGEFLRIGLLKSGRYTVTRPLQLGAAISRDPAGLPALQAFGDAIGVAFQLRDDLLDVYGEAAALGKPAGADALRGGANAVVRRAKDLASAQDRQRLAGRRQVAGWAGSDLAEVVERSGARDWAEAVIGNSLRRAHRALAELPADGGTHELLGYLAERAAYRTG